MQIQYQQRYWSISLVRFEKMITASTNKLNARNIHAQDDTRMYLEIEVRRETQKMLKTATKKLLQKRRKQMKFYYSQDCHVLPSHLALREN